MLPGHPPPSAVNVFFYAQQNPIIRVKTATPCQKSVIETLEYEDEDLKPFYETLETDSDESDQDMEGWLLVVVTVTMPAKAQERLHMAQQAPDLLGSPICQIGVHSVGRKLKPNASISGACGNSLSSVEWVKIVSRCWELIKLGVMTSCLVEVLVAPIGYMEQRRKPN